MSQSYTTRQMTREPAAPPALRVIRAFGQFRPRSDTYAGDIITPVGLYRDRLLHCGYCEEVKAPVAPVASVAPEPVAAQEPVAQKPAAAPKPLVPERPKV